VKQFLIASSLNSFQTNSFLNATGEAHPVGKGMEEAFDASGEAMLEALVKDPPGDSWGMEEIAIGQWLDHDDDCRESMEKIFKKEEDQKSIRQKPMSVGVRAAALLATLDCPFQSEKDEEDSHFQIFNHFQAVAKEFATDVDNASTDMSCHHQLALQLIIMLGPGDGRVSCWQGPCALHC